MKNTWIDSKGKVAYIKGKPSVDRLNKHELNEAQTAVKVTLSSGIEFYPPFHQIKA